MTPSPLYSRGVKYTTFILPHRTPKPLKTTAELWIRNRQWKDTSSTYGVERQRRTLPILVYGAILLGDLGGRCGTMRCFVRPKINSWGQSVDLATYGPVVPMLLICLITTSVAKPAKAHASMIRRLSYHKDDRAMRPIYECPGHFRESLTMPTATFPEIFNGLFFRWMLHV